MMITVIGNLVADPEPRNAGSHKLTKLRIASNERVRDASGEWKDGDTTYIDVSCWRRLAENSLSLRKGQRLVIHGKLKGRSFVRKDGTNGYGYEIDATDIGTSIMWSGKSEKNNIAPDLESPWEE
jgi:single-strand DNA-binding protein